MLLSKPQQRPMLSRGKSPMISPVSLGLSYLSPVRSRFAPPLSAASDSLFHRLRVVVPRISPRVGNLPPIRINGTMGHADTPSTGVLLRVYGLGKDRSQGHISGNSGDHQVPPIQLGLILSHLTCCHGECTGDLSTDNIIAQY